METIETAQPHIDLQTSSNEMSVSGKLKISDIFENRIIYRRLEPLDKKLAGLKKAGGKMQLMNDRIPRKDEEDYARASMWFLNQAQKLRKVSTPIKELVYIGDSLYSDGTAYQNLRQLSQWSGSSFIGHDDLSAKPSADIDVESGLYMANRWSGLASWAAWTLGNGLQLDESTAVVIDIDKTLIGARGRNDHVIDQARLEGIYRTMDAVLGNSFDRAAFERQYAELNQAEYHPITADNQDYLAYICLVLNAKLLQLDEVIGEVQENRIDNFEQFARWVNTRLMINPMGGERLRQVHEAIMMSFLAGDPTPFKRLRQEEFRMTLERMGNVADEQDVSDYLQDEITITREVVDISQWLIGRGCLTLCMSDKPDESACPDRNAAEEFLPIHQVATHCVGCNIQEQLNVL